MSGIGPIRPGAPFNAFVDGFAKDLVGVVGVQIEDSDGNVVLARTTADIIEIAEIDDFARYRYAGTAPDSQGDYLVVWDDDDGNSTSDVLVVSQSVFASTGSLPCGEWIDGDDVADCCENDAVGTYTSLFDEVASIAAGVFYELSDRRFPGVCGPVTVRPPAMCQHGTLFGTVGWRYDPAAGMVPSFPCGCDRLSEVPLEGYPIQEIYEVKIDGVTLDVSEYRLDYSRMLVRLADADGNPQSWPSVQRLDRADTQPDTWSVSYTYGEPPPEIARKAAAQLACQLYAACPGGSGDCQLPSGVTRLTRLGVSQEIVKPIADLLRKGETGLEFVDTFMGIYASQGVGGSFWGPDAPGYPRPVG